MSSRRGGKSRALGVLAAFLASCLDYRSILAPGERGVLPVLAPTKDQATSSFNFISGALENLPALAGLIRSRTADTLSLSTGIDIVVRPASFRTVRGINSIAAICDETAFWRSDESANPDLEIIRALKPSLMNSKGPLIAISSPYARRGYLWTTYSKHFGKDGSRTLVAQAASQVMNPDVDRDWIAEQFADDPIAAEAEINAQFRNDADAFVDREVVERAVISGRIELPYYPGRHYVGFVDPSGGSGKDSFTLCIAHSDKLNGVKIVVIDAIREVRPPMSPDGVCREFAAFLKDYKIRFIIGDNYADEWPKERFSAHGIQYDKSEKPKAGLYQELLPLLNSSRIELLDLPRLITQLCQLERRTSSVGRDIIDHPKGATYHDDLANAIAGAASVLMGQNSFAISPEALASAARPGPFTARSRPIGGPRMPPPRALGGFTGNLSDLASPRPQAPAAAGNLFGSTSFSDNYGNK